MKDKGMKIKRLFVFCSCPPTFYNREFDAEDGYVIDHIGKVFVVQDKESAIEISDSLPHIVEFTKIEK